MVALNPAYAPDKSTSRTQNRVRNFFVRSGDRVRVEQPVNRLGIREKYDASVRMASGHSKFANGATTAAMVSLFSEGAQLATKPKGEWIYPEGGSTDINTYEENGVITVRTNGILGDRNTAVALANGYDKPVFFNPSGGFLADVWESFTQKIGFGSGDGLALGFAQGVSGAKYPLNIIAHSQGTLTVTNAQFQYGLPNWINLHPKKPGNHLRKGCSSC